MGGLKIPLNQGRINLLGKDKDLVLKDPNLKEMNNGLFNFKSYEAIGTYNSTAGEKILQGPTNQFLIMGNDRIRGADSGLGGAGATQACSIDIVAGLGGVFARGTDQEGDPLYTEKSPELDAARIYLTQKGNIDDYFHLPPGENGMSEGKSAIAMKADDIRVISRSGIKLVTGTDTHDMGPGTPNNTKYGIDLIGGSGQGSLEPIVKANQMVLTLSELSSMMVDTLGLIFNICGALQATNSLLGMHFHPPPSPQVPIVPPSPTTDLGSSIINKTLDRAAEDVVSLMNGVLAFNQNSLEPSGIHYFGSEDNYTT
jgi:hypothetical protein